MSKSIGRVFGMSASSPYGYETDYQKYLRGYNPYNYEQTLRTMVVNSANANLRPPYQIQGNQNTTPTYSEPLKTYSPSNSPADMMYKDWLITNDFLNRLKQTATENEDNTNYRDVDNNTPDFSELNNSPLNMGLTAMPGQTPMRNLNTEIINNREIVETPYSNNILENDCYQSKRFEPFARQVRWNEGENQGITYAQNNISDTATDANYTKLVDYSLYGDDFSKEFIDKMLNDTEFQRILNEYIIPNEGGYNNDLADTGGETNMGIAKKYHPNEDIKGMTRERANAIYYRDYYNWNGLNKLPYPIRGFVVDYGLPTNPQYALKTVHNVLGIPKSATVIGPTTLGIFENYTDEDYNDFLEKYRAEMNKHFNEVAQRNPQKRKFLKGWLNRANRAHLAR